MTPSNNSSTFNLSIAKAIDKGQRVTPPGIPPGFKKHSDLISDCIEP